MHRTESSDVGWLIVFIYVTYVVRICTETALSSTIHRHHIAECVHRAAMENVALMALIVNACITKNIPQMRGYMVFKTLDQFSFLLKLRIPRNRHFAVLLSVRLVVLVVELVVVYVFVRRFSRHYSWYSFKKLGTDKSLKDAHMTRKQLVLVFKILLVFRFRNMMTTRLVLIPTYMFYTVNILDIAVAAVFFYYLRSENTGVRIFVFVFYVLSAMSLVVMMCVHTKTLFSYGQM